MQKETKRNKQKYSKTTEENICGDYLVTAGAAAAGIAVAGIAAVAVAAGAGNTNHRA